MAAGALVVATGPSALAHAPFARPLLMSLGGCPMAGARMTPAVSREGASDGARRRPERAAGAVAAGARVHARLDHAPGGAERGRGASTSTATTRGPGLMKCTDVRARGPRAARDAGHARRALPRVRPHDRLVNMTTFRTHLAPAVAATEAQAIVASLAAKLGSARRGARATSGSSLGAAPGRQHLDGTLPLRRLRRRRHGDERAVVRARPSASTTCPRAIDANVDVRAGRTRRRYAGARLLSTSPPKLAVVMVGLPARGKTFIARKIARYLSWLGYRTQMFNVGSYRRARLGSHQRHSFFDPRNEAGQTRAPRGRARRPRRHARVPRRGGRHRHLRRDQQHARAARARPARAASPRGLEVVFVESTCDRPGHRRVEHPRDQGPLARLRGRARRGGRARLPPSHRALRERLRRGRRGRRPLRQDHRRGPQDGAPPHPGVPARAGRPLPAQPARAAAQRVAHAPRRERVQRARAHRRRRAAQRRRPRLRRPALERHPRSRRPRRRRVDEHVAPHHRHRRAPRPALSRPGARSTRSTPASATA